MSEEEVLTYVRGKFENLKLWAIDRWGAERCMQHHVDIETLLSSYNNLLVVTTDIFSPAVKQGKINELITLKFKEQAGIDLKADECDHIAQYFRMLVDVV
jgi:hypothetical protein